MKIKVTLEEQPVEFIERQPPQSRKRLRDALHAVEQGAAFPEPLEDELAIVEATDTSPYELVLAARVRPADGIRTAFSSTILNKI
ncbi:MAG: hypothetical protein ACLQU4_21765 [Limisphaerales bacterium]